MRPSVYRIALLNFLICSPCLFSQTGSVFEPVRYVGGISIDPKVHDGRLRWAVGVESRQTVRVNRSHPDQVEGSGWTYSHASNLAYWNKTFYQQYLSNPVDEHIAPGQTLITTSLDGREWSKPTVVFPPYEPPPGTVMPDSSNGYMMHQRMGFYTARDGRLLVLAFYGHAEDPFKEGGIGRVVREAYKDGTFGPIFFIRYSSHTQWNEGNTVYPFYKKSDDPGFVAACDELLNDKLKTLQWWDEDRGLDGFYSIKAAGEAISCYQRKDGNVVALWKRSLCALSMDGGETFSRPVRVPTLTMAGGKIWGQRTSDGRYAMCYNPIERDEHRYPLIIVTSDDGIIYDDMLIVQGEVPPRRFYGRWKDFGPCYTRGILPGNGNPPGDDMWITYSMNKEDVWVSRIPVPVRYQVEEPIQDVFDDMLPGGNITDWNVYAPVWAPVSVVKFPDDVNKSLELRDKEPYDYARAVRVFQEAQNVRIDLRVFAKHNDAGMLDVEILDRFGNRPVRIRFDNDRKIKALDVAGEKTIQSYQSDRWYAMSFIVDARPFGKYSLSIDGESVLQNVDLAEAVLSVERLSLRTGPYRDLPNRNTENQQPGPPLSGSDEPVPLAVFNIDDVVVSAGE